MTNDELILFKILMKKDCEPQRQEWDCVYSDFQIDEKWSQRWSEKVDEKFIEIIFEKWIVINIKSISNFLLLLKYSSVIF